MKYIGKWRKRNHFCPHTVDIFIFILFIFGVLMPLSAIFQQYQGDQF
jgi:hypothetical protein